MAATTFNFAEELAPRMTADGLMALAEVERRLGEIDRRREPRAASPGRRAIDRMGATPAEIDRMARQMAIEAAGGLEEYYDEDFREWGEES